MAQEILTPQVMDNILTPPAGVGEIGSGTFSFFNGLASKAVWGANRLESPYSMPVVYNSAYSKDALKSRTLDAVNSLDINSDGNVKYSDIYNLQRNDPNRSNLKITNPKNAIWEDTKNDIVISRKIKEIEVIDGSTTKIVLENDEIKYAHTNGISAPKSASDGGQADTGAGNAAVVYYNTLNSAASDGSDIIFTDNGAAGNFIKYTGDLNNIDYHYTNITLLTSEGKVPVSAIMVASGTVKTDVTAERSMLNPPGSAGLQISNSELSTLYTGSANNSKSNAIHLNNRIESYDEKFNTITNRISNPELLTYKGQNPTFNDRYEQMERYGAFFDNEFKIGDVILKIPPTHITIAQMRACDSTQLIGQEAKATAGYAHKIVIKINTVFEGHDMIDGDLKRIMTQFRYCPINIIHSEDLFNLTVAENSWLADILKKDLGSERTLKYVPVTMDEYTLYTIEGHPGALGCSMQFSLCNFSAYFDSDTSTKGLGYFQAEFEDGKLKPDKYNESLKVDVSDRILKQTSHLEKGYHPYNIDINYILKDKEQWYYRDPETESSNLDSSYSHVRVGKLSSVTGQDQFGKIRVQEISTLNDTFASILCDSISLRYENNFAWYPIVGFSHAVPQYIGPGHTQLSLNARVQFDEQNLTNDGKMLASLLKTYNERLENENLFTVYDDRFAIVTPLTIFANSQVCSIQHVGITSLPNHPGWSDLNITFHKSTFVTSKIDHDPVAAYDDYWGLRRVISFVNNNEKTRTWLENKVDQQIKERMEDLGILTRWANNAGVNAASLNTTHELASAINFGVNSLIDDKKAYTAMEYFKIVPSGFADKYKEIKDLLVSANAAFDKITGFNSGGDFLAVFRKVYDKNRIDIAGVISLCSGWQSPISKAFNSKIEYAKAKEAGDILLLGLANFMLRNPALFNSGIMSKEASLEPLRKISRQYLLDETDCKTLGKFAGDFQTVINRTGSLWDVINKSNGVVLAYIEEDEVVSVLSKNNKIITTADVKSIIQAAISKIENTINTKAGEKAPTQVVTSLYSDYSQNKNKYFIQFVQIDKQSSTNPLIVWNIEAEKRRQKENAKFSDVKIDANSLPKPFSAHRYYPQSEMLVKFMPQLSGSVGGWFYHGLKANSNNVGSFIEKISDDVKTARSYAVDTPAYRAVIPVNSHAGEKLNSANMYNPFAIFTGITHPSSVKFLEDGFLSAIANDPSKRNDFVFTSAVFGDVNTIIENSDGSTIGNKAFSGISDLIFANKLEFGEHTQVIENINKNFSIIKELEYNTTKVCNESREPSNITKVFDASLNNVGAVTPSNKVVKKSQTTQRELTSQILSNYDVPIDGAQKIEWRQNGLFPYQMNNMSGVKDPGLVGNNSKVFNLNSTPTNPDNSTSSNLDTKKSQIASLIRMVLTKILSEEDFVKASQKLGGTVDPNKTALFISGYIIGLGDDILNTINLSIEEVEMLARLAFSLNMFTEGAKTFNKNVEQMAAKFGSKIVNFTNLLVTEINITYTQERSYNQYDGMSTKLTYKKINPSSNNGTQSTLSQGMLLLFNLFLTASVKSKLKWLLDISTNGKDALHNSNYNFYLPSETKTPTPGNIMTVVPRHYEAYNFVKDVNWKKEYSPEEIFSRPEIVLQKFKDSLESFTESAIPVAQKGVSIIDLKTEPDTTTQMYYTNQFMQSMLPTIGMQNAFPTYKLYVIDSATSEIKFNLLDDYYDFRQVQDLMVLKSKNDPLHILKARVYVDERFITINGIPNQRDTVRDVPFEKRNNLQTADSAGREGATRFNLGRVPLRAGMRINLRLGYHTDPRMLDSVFIGTITSLSQTFDPHIFEIEAMGDGRELSVPSSENNQNMVGQNFRQIASKILRANSNVVHFGKVYGTALERFSREHLFLTSLCKHAYNTEWFQWLIAGSSGAAIGGFATTAFLTPGLGVALSAGAALGAAGMGAYAVGKTLILDPVDHAGIMKEKIHVKFNDWHKGTHAFSWTKYIHGDVHNLEKAAYQIGRIIDETYTWGNDPVDDNIFAVDIWNNSIFSFGNNFEFPVNNLKSIWQVLEDIRRFYPNYCLDVKPYGSRSTIYLGPRDWLMWKTDDPLLAMMPHMKEISGQYYSGSWYNDSMKRYLNELESRNELLREDNNAADKPPLVPFQKVHYALAHSNIIMNGIKCTPERGWNAVIVNWGKQKEKPISLIANSEIHPGAIKKKVFDLNWCLVEELALSYALSVLKEGVEKMYGGSLVLRGNPKIEPYDRVYVCDKVNKMYGWIEVETVIHKFDNNYGFTTHIVPQMVCATNSDSYKTHGHLVRQLINRTFGGMTIASFGLGVTLGAGTLALTAALPELAPILTVFSILGVAWSGKVAIFDKALSGMQQLFKKMEDSNNIAHSYQDEAAYVNELLASVAYENHMTSSATTGFLLGRVLKISHNIFKEPKLAGEFIKVSLFNGYAHSAKFYTNSFLNFGGKRLTAKEQHMSKISDKINKLRREIIGEESEALSRKNMTGDASIKFSDDVKLEIDNIKNALNNGDNSKLSADLQKLSKDDLQKKLDKLKEKFKILEEDFLKSSNEHIKMVETNDHGFLEKVSTKARSSKLNAYAKGTFKAGLATLVFEAIFKAIESIPMMLETFMIDSVTKNNCITISPLWSKNTLMIAGLDGFQTQNSFMHLKGMLLNAKRILDSVPEMLRYNTPNIDQTLLDGIASKSTVESIAKGASRSNVRGRGDAELAAEVKAKFGKIILAALTRHKKPNNGECYDGILNEVNLLAILCVESGFGQSRTTNKSTASGLMQVISKYHLTTVQKEAKALGLPIPADFEKAGQALAGNDTLAIYTGVSIFINELNVAIKADKNKSKNCYTLFHEACARYNQGDGKYKSAEGNAYANKVISTADFLNSNAKSVEAVPVPVYQTRLLQLMNELNRSGNPVDCSGLVAKALDNKFGGKLGTKLITDAGASGEAGRTGATRMRTSIKNKNLLVDLGFSSNGTTMDFKNGYTTNPLKDVEPGDVLFFQTSAKANWKGSKGSDNVPINHVEIVFAIPTDGSNNDTKSVITMKASKDNKKTIQVSFNRYDVGKNSQLILTSDCGKDGSKKNPNGPIALIQSYGKLSQLTVEKT